MFSKKSLFVAAACMSLSLLAASAAKAEGSKCYTLASLQGNYAVIGTYGANVALALGKRQMDGAGNETGTFLVNKPTPGSTTGDRTLVSGTHVATYTVNCDGTGVMTQVTTTASGTVTDQMEDFLITGAVEREGVLIATSIVDMQRTPSAIVAGGVFLMRTYTRLPN
jgi:hypothetical protein